MATLAAFDLTGRTALVTGAAGGIGRATAELLAEAGATVHCADLDGPGAHETAERITGSGGTAAAHAVDVTDRRQVAEAVGAVVGTHGCLDVLANIAGIMHLSTVVETTDADLDRVFAVNFKGVLHGCQEAARVMTQRGSGSIITMASGAVDTGRAGLLCYSAAKAAVVQLTRTLATEAGPHGVRVNAVAPGYVRTPMTARPTAEEQRAVEAPMVRATPLGRLGSPLDIARTVLFLACDASAFVTGQILRPNGGIAMPW
ncbi:SDR family oxidoreductase [Streptomyces sp. RB6PN25]|uniref:SDR family oxidoreductase n=1 Tax=Streptomyces humicola TaxID=2953240 RepID=A0ABT1PQT4_9ACTN|nr:SDR family NAD(P)-dependent oxidoreductase [Streptomyces humicola]MCQ4080038.1 SDR family oxidoreductase [Streptomyces humicola]